MNTTTAKFPPETIRLAELAKAMAHPARIAILQYLAAKNACVCGDIVDALPLSQATVSQHLKVLKETGLIQGNIEGPRVCYCIEPVALAQAQQDLNAFLNLASANCDEGTCGC